MKKKQCDVFGERLATLRKEKKLTQAELSETLKIQRVTIAKYETGQRAPSIDHLILFAEYFNVPTDYLLGLSDVNSLDTELTAVCNYTGLSEDSIELLHELNVGKRLREKLSMEHSVERIDIISNIIEYLNERPLILNNIYTASLINEHVPDLLGQELKHEMVTQFHNLDRNKFEVLSGYRYKTFLKQEIMSDLEWIINQVIKRFEVENFDEVEYEDFYDGLCSMSLASIVCAQNATLSEALSNSELKERLKNAQHNPKNE